MAAAGGSWVKAQQRGGPVKSVFIPAGSKTMRAGDGYPIKNPPFVKTDKVSGYKDDAWIHELSGVVIVKSSDGYYHAYSGVDKDGVFKGGHLVTKGTFAELKTELGAMNAAQKGSLLGLVKNKMAFMPGNEAQGVALKGAKPVTFTPTNKVKFMDDAFIHEPSGVVLVSNPVGAWAAYKGVDAKGMLQGDSIALGASKDAIIKQLTDMDAAQGGKILGVTPKPAQHVPQVVNLAGMIGKGDLFTDLGTGITILKSPGVGFKVLDAYGKTIGAPQKTVVKAIKAANQGLADGTIIPVASSKTPKLMPTPAPKTAVPPVKLKDFDKVGSHEWLHKNASASLNYNKYYGEYTVSANTPGYVTKEATFKSKSAAMAELTKWIGNGEVKVLGGTDAYKPVAKSVAPKPVQKSVQPPAPSVVPKTPYPVPSTPLKAPYFPKQADGTFLHSSGVKVSPGPNGWTATDKDGQVLQAGVKTKAGIIKNLTLMHNVGVIYLGKNAPKPVTPVSKPAPTPVPKPAPSVTKPGKDLKLKDLEHPYSGTWKEPQTGMKIKHGYGKEYSVYDKDGNLVASVKSKNEAVAVINSKIKSGSVSPTPVKPTTVDLKPITGGAKVVGSGATTANLPAATSQVDIQTKTGAKKQVSGVAFENGTTVTYNENTQKYHVNSAATGSTIAIHDTFEQASGFASTHQNISKPFGTGTVDFVPHWKVPEGSTSGNAHMLQEQGLAFTDYAKGVVFDPKTTKYHVVDLEEGKEVGGVHDTYADAAKAAQTGPKVKVIKNAIGGYDKVSAGDVVKPPPPEPKAPGFSHLEGTDTKHKDLTPYYAKAHKSLTPDESSALSYWQGSGYHQINSALWGGSIKGSVKSYIDAIDSAMSKMAIPRNIVVVRSEGKDHSLFKQSLALDVGQKYVSKGYDATSTNPSNSWGGGGVKLIYRVPKGTPGYYFNGAGHSSFQSEWELLLPRNLTWNVVGKHSTKNGVTLTLEPDWIDIHAGD